MPFPPAATPTGPRPAESGADRVVLRATAALFRLPAEDRRFLLDRLAAESSRRNPGATAPEHAEEQRQLRRILGELRDLIT